MPHVEVNGYKVDVEIMQDVLHAMMVNRPLLLVGPVGSGKLVLAQIIGKIRGGAFRAPHHTVSQHGMFGNTTPHKEYPGEVDLAKGGVLLLDEFPEFRRGVVARLGEQHQAEQFAAEPTYLPVFTSASCPCGFLGHHSRKCACSTDAKKRFTNRLNEYLGFFPAADRIYVGSASPDYSRVIPSPFAA